ncbi:MAG: Ig-like domain-containing protein [Nitrospira sp.]
MTPVKVAGSGTRTHFTEWGVSMRLFNWFQRIRSKSTQARKIRQKRLLRIEQFEERNLLAVAAVDDAYFLNTGGVPDYGLNVLDNDVDAVSASIISGPSNAAYFTFNPDGTFDYYPNFSHGTDSFIYEASDGTNTDQAEVTFMIDTPPIGYDNSYSTPRNTTLDIPIAWLGGDYDLGDTVTFPIDSQPTNGTLSIELDGTYEYQPNTDFVGTDTFTYHADDGLRSSDIHTITIHVWSLNAVGDTYSTPYNTPLTVTSPTVLDNDVQLDNLPISVSSYSQAYNGAVTMSSSGTFSFTPDTSYRGDTVFTYTATDGSDTSSSGVLIRVGAPLAVGQDTLQTSVNATLTLSSVNGLLSNDTTFDGSTESILEYDNSTITDFGEPGDAISTSHGTLTVYADGSLVYVPANNYHGTDSFTIVFFDGAFKAGETVTIYIDTPPISDDIDEAQSYIDADKTGNVLTPASDTDGDTLSAVLVSEPSSGDLDLESDGSYTYTPDGTETGIITFTYKVFDGYRYSDEYTVSLLIVPHGYDDEFYMSHNTTMIVTSLASVLLNDVGPSLTVTGSLPAPSHGSLTLNSDGTFTYTPTANYIGDDTFSYVLSSGGWLDSGTVTIHIL